MTNITSALILITAMILMAIGVGYDCKFRKYPNSIIISLIILGFFYGIFSNTLLSGILGFLLFNVFGYQMYKRKLLNPGDSKFLSTLFLYLDILSIKGPAILIVFILLVGGLYGISFYKKKYQTNEKVMEKLKQEMNSMKYLFAFKINTFKSTDSYNYDNLEVLKKDTMPFTLPFYIAFVVTQIILIFV